MTRSEDDRARRVLAGRRAALAAFGAVGAVRAVGAVGAVRAVGAVGEVGGLATSREARAQSRADAGYPARPIRLIVPLSAGGAVDTVARVVGARLSTLLSQPIVVENKPGANTNIGTELVAKAPADGYTLLLGSTSIVTNNILYANLPFNGLRDFAPVSRLAYAPLVLVVAANSPFRTVQDLVAAGIANPGALTYGSAGNGSSGQMASALFASEAKFDALHVPYHGGAPALVDLIADRLSFMLLNFVEVIQHLQSGRLRALAVTSPQRAAQLRDVPTMSELGYPGVTVSVWWVLLAPAATPSNIVARLNAETKLALADPAVTARLGSLGAVITPSTADELGAFLRSESARWERVIRAANIRGE